MQKGIKSQKGITLVALVITIIVMLILVAVSVTVAINGGLFTKAKEAGNAWEAQSNEEADGNIVKVNVDETITTTTIDGAINTLKERPTTETPVNPEEPQTITFTISGWEQYISGAAETTTHTTTQGKKWEEWIAENPSLGLGDADYSGYVGIPGTYYTLYDYDDTGAAIKPQDIIENGKIYYLSAE